MNTRKFETTAFGYRKITVERPLRLNFQASAERIERLRGERAFQNLATSKKKEKKQNAAEIAAGRMTQEKILALVRSLSDTLYKNRAAFEAALDAALNAAAGRLDAVKISAPVRKAILNALSERDATADICFDQDGKPEPDAELRDYENVPLRQDVHDFFAREVLPHVPDAWINSEVRDALDGEIGKVGYEINFNRYFYQYQPPRALEEIEADIKLLEREILEMLRA